ncbi:thiamine phosphate synthase [candidate division KSB1 bacterium]|nr:thiamine phosphate synthase [candidate division KSB1 bacterium]
MKIKGYYFITDPGYTRHGVLNDIKTALDCGVSIIQYRDKNKTIREKYREAEQAAALCRSYNALFIVNDSVEIAHAVNADGVNVGQNDLPAQKAAAILGTGKMIGVSVSSLEEVEDAIKAGAGYLGAGPITATVTKPDAAAPAGVQLILQIKARTRIPVAAIGGIDFSNVRQVLAAGAEMICSISAVYQAESLEKGIKKMIQIYKEVQS